MYSLVRTTAPTLRPVSLAEVRGHLRIAADEEADDVQLTALIDAATDHVEIETGLQLLTATYTLKLDRLPYGSGELLLPKPPVQSVTSLSYTQDSDGSSTTWSSSNYIVSTGRRPCRITPAYNTTWPTPRAVGDCVTIVYVSGYTAASLIPAGLRQAILLLIGHWWAHREGVAVGTTATEIPRAVGRLLANHMVGEEWACYG